VFCGCVVVLLGVGLSGLLLAAHWRGVPNAGGVGYVYRWLAATLSGWMVVQGTKQHAALLQAPLAWSG